MKNFKVNTQQKDSFGSWILASLFGIVAIFLSCSVGELFGTSLASRINGQADPSKYLTSLSARILSGCISGLLTGVLSWITVRPALRNTGLSLSWHLATLASVLVCETIMGYIVFGESKVSHSVILFVSAVCGFVVGLIQWLYIRNASQKTFIWVIASSFAWLMLTAVFVLVGTLD